MKNLSARHLSDLTEHIRKQILHIKIKMLKYLGEYYIIKVVNAEREVLFFAINKHKNVQSIF